MVSRWNSSGGVSADRSEGTPQKLRSPEPSSVTGGTTADVRHFGNAVPFMLSGGTSYDSRNFHTPQDVDVRNCLSSCKTPTSWFMSGPDVLSAYRLLNLDGSKLSIVNVAWSMGLYREATVLVYLGLSTSSLLKILPALALETSANDNACQTSPFDAIVESVTSSSDVHCSLVRDSNFHLKTAVAGDDSQSLTAERCRTRSWCRRRASRHCT